MRRGGRGSSFNSSSRSSNALLQGIGHFRAQKSQVRHLVALDPSPALARRALHFSHAQKARILPVDLQIRMLFVTFVTE
jgi:hypothetical protein